MGFDSTTSCLELSNQKLDKIPEDQIETLFETDEDLKSVKTLNFSGNELQSLMGIGKFSKAKVAYFQNNALPTFPLEILWIPLRTINLSHNKIDKLPRELIGLAKFLKQLICSHNLITEIPPHYSQLKHLNELNLSHNQISIIPEQLSQLRNLKTLDLGYNRISQFPKQMAELKRLRTLILAENQLELFDPELCVFPKLETLDLSSNILKNVPGEIQKLSKLRFLYLGRNPLITALPRRIANLDNLQVLDLVQTPKLKSLPESIFQRGKLPALVVLAFSPKEEDTTPKKSLGFDMRNSLDFKRRSFLK